MGLGFRSLGLCDLGMESKTVRDTVEKIDWGQTEEDCE